MFAFQPDWLPFGAACDENYRRWSKSPVFAHNELMVKQATAPDLSLRCVRFFMLLHFNYIYVHVCVDVVVVVGTVVTKCDWQRIEVACRCCQRRNRMCSSNASCAQLFIFWLFLFVFLDNDGSSVITAWTRALLRQMSYVSVLVSARLPAMCGQTRPFVADNHWKQC